MKDIASDNAGRLVYLFYYRQGFFDDRLAGAQLFCLVFISGMSFFLAGLYHIGWTLMICFLLVAVGWFGRLIVREQIEDVEIMIYQVLLELDQQTELIDINRLGNFYEVLCLSKFNPILIRDFYLEVKRLVASGSPVASTRFIQDLYYYLGRSHRIRWLLEQYPVP